MLNKLRKIVIVGVALMGAVVAHGATTRYVELRSTLQPNTTGLNAIFVSSGTIKTLSASTVTVTGTLNVTGTLTPLTLAGTINDTSTTTHSGGQTFSSATVSNTLTVATVTVNGQIAFSDGNIRSSNTGFILGVSSFSVPATSTATTSSSSFVFTNIQTSFALHKSTNKVLLWASGTWGNDTANDGCDLGFFSDTTFISATNGGQRVRNPAASVLQQSAYSVILPYAPGDTSSHTYKLGFRAAAGGTCTINGVTSQDNPIVAIEIGQ